MGRALRRHMISLGAFGAILLAPGFASSSPPAPAGDAAAADPAPEADSSGEPAGAGPTNYDTDGMVSAIDSGLSKLAEMNEEAKKSDDLGRAACVKDKNDRAEAVWQLANGEVLIINDASTIDSMKQFAQEKLGASADRVDQLVKEAKACGLTVGKSDNSGNKGSSTEPTAVPASVSKGLGTPKIPPLSEGGWPATASPTE